MKFSKPMQEENNNNKCDEPHNVLPFSYDFLSTTQVQFLEENISSISLYPSPLLFSFFPFSILYLYIVPSFVMSLFFHPTIAELHILPLAFTLKQFRFILLKSL